MQIEALKIKFGAETVNFSGTTRVRSMKVGIGLRFGMTTQIWVSIFVLDL